jgi:hypothetical protein
MSGLRPTGMKGEVIDSMIASGDILLSGEVIGSLGTAGAGTWAGALIATGLFRRTGPGAGYTDTTDTAANILAALAGNSPSAEVAPGTTFRLRVLNTVAFLLTFAAGVGVVTGTGTLNVSASTWRDFLFTVLNSSPAQQLNCNTVNASAAVTFVLPPGISAYKMGPDPQAVNITPGMSVSGTGISAGTTVIGVTQGQGGVIGVTLSANATATNNGVQLTFSPTIQVDGIGSGTL